MNHTGLRLALIKQDIYQDLYACPPATSEPYRFSLMRSGPLGLFTAFHADCFVVDHRTSAAVWREKITDCPHHRTEEQWFEVLNKKVRYQGVWTEQSAFAIDCRDIDFEQYDIVIAVDACIPEVITCKVQKPLWCYYISEACMRSYQNSAAAPLPGYDVFLNQMFRPSDHPAYQALAEHVCEFPYMLQYPGIHKDLYDFEAYDQGFHSPHGLRLAMPRYVQEELASADLERLQAAALITTPSGDVNQFLKVLNQASIYARLGNKTKFGNETLEAVCAGNLFVSSRMGWKNRVFSPSIYDIDGDAYHIGQLQQLIGCLEEIARYPEKAEQERKRQQAIALDLGYERPIRDLLARLHQIKGASSVSVPGFTQPMPSLNLPDQSRRPTCLVLAFDAFDQEMARSMAIFYSQAGFSVEISKTPRPAELVVWMRGRPPSGFHFREVTSTVHFYPYLATPYAEDMESLQGTQATIVHPSESLIFKIRDLFPQFSYLQSMPPVWLGEWACRYSTPAAERRFQQPVHIGHFKDYNLKTDDPLLKDFIRACDRLDAHVWGRGWEQYVKPSAAMGVMAEPISRAYSRYRVALGIMYSYQRHRTVSMRAWEAPLSGCLLLTEALPRSGDLLPPGVIEIDYATLSMEQIRDLLDQHDPSTIRQDALEFWQRSNSSLFRNLGCDAVVDLDVSPFVSKIAEPHFRSGEPAEPG